MPRPDLRIAGVVLVLALLANNSTSSAHVGWSSNANNRYYRVAVMADRIRIAYSLFLRISPAGTVGKRIDRNRDNRLSEEEIQAFAHSLASEVFRSFEATGMGETHKILWKSPSMEVGGNIAEERSPNLGVSLELLGTVCLDDKPEGREQRWRLTSNFILPLIRGGETELHLDPSPGIKVLKSAWHGEEIGMDSLRLPETGSLTTLDYELRFIVERSDGAGLDETCKTRILKERPQSASHILMALAAAATAILLLVLIFRRRHR